nr:type II toxin-antitoxin system VapC family toxin [Tianweitania aestuarii]
MIDTHVLLWWTTGQSYRVSEAASGLFESARAVAAVKVSAMTMWEVALLDSQNRITLEEGFAAWRSRVEAMMFLHFIPIDNRIAVEANRLPEPFHRDPADRLIVATARLLDMPLLTADTKILDYPFVKTIW